MGQTLKEISTSRSFLGAIFDDILVLDLLKFYNIYQ